MMVFVNGSIHVNDKVILVFANDIDNDEFILTLGSMDSNGRTFK